MSILSKEMYAECELCPRRCRANRLAGETGFCGMDSRLRAGRAALHFWEEPCLSGTEGSGAVFFSGCSLRCVYCQNREISADCGGIMLTEERLADVFLELQDQGANNINLVTAVQFLPSIVPALESAKKRGLSIPVLYNSGGYERPEVLRELEGLIDIWLPDFKYLNPELSQRYSRCGDYPDRAKEALAEMVRQCGSPQFDDRGRMRKGVIVRHLLLPGCGTDSKRILRYLHETYGCLIYISILRQYTPMPWIGSACPELDRKITGEEYERIVNFALRIGIEQAYIQEGEAAAESFIPSFRGEGLEK